MSIILNSRNLFGDLDTGYYGGATVTLQYLDEAGDMQDYADGTHTAPVQILINPGLGVQMYVNISGASGTTAITAKLRGLR